MSRTLVYVYDIEPPRSSIGLGVPIRDRTNDLSTVSASGPSYTSALLHQLQRYRTTLPAYAPGVVLLRLLLAPSAWDRSDKCAAQIQHG